MENLKSYELFEQDAQLKTKTFNGVPRYPSVVEYIGLITKNADSGSTTEIASFLRKKPRPDQPATNAVYLLKFIEEALDNIKVAQPDLYAKVSAEGFIKKIQQNTTK
jgi:hypothetical protein